MKIEVERLKYYILVKCSYWLLG